MLASGLYYIEICIAIMNLITRMALALFLRRSKYNALQMVSSHAEK